jgi:hypothetical protein
MSECNLSFAFFLYWFGVMTASSSIWIFQTKPEWYYILALLLVGICYYVFLRSMEWRKGKFKSKVLGEKKIYKCDKSGRKQYVG